MTDFGKIRSPGKPATTDAWENEGGTVHTPVPQLPAGVVAVTATQYIVGPYRYTSLDDALAEHRRQIAHRMADPPAKLHD